MAGSPTAVSTSGAVNTPSKGGMTTGAKIGAGVGTVGGFAVIGFLVYFLIFLLKRRSQEKYNAERVAQIQAKVGRTFSSDNTSNGSFSREGLRGGSAGFDIPRRPISGSRAESLRRSLPPLPPQYETVSPQESYSPYRHLTNSIAHEMHNLDPSAIAQHTQLPSHYSFSGPPAISPVSPTTEGLPPRMTPVTPVQQYAAAQLPSHFPSSSLPVTPISPTEELPRRMTPVQEYAAAQLPSHYSFSGPSVTGPVSPIEDPTRRPAHVQEIAAAQLPSHYSFSGPPNGFVRLVDVPARNLTPAQELASARLRSNMSPMGLADMDN